MRGVTLSALVFLWVCWSPSKSLSAEPNLLLMSHQLG